MSQPTTSTRRLLPPFLQSPDTPAASSAPSNPPHPIVAGIADFAQRILAAGDDDPMGQHVPAAMRGMLSAALPMVVRQMSVIDPAELARGLRMFADELGRIAALGEDHTAEDDGARARLA